MKEILPPEKLNLKTERPVNDNMKNFADSLEIADIASARILYCMNRKDEAMKILFKMASSEVKSLSAIAYFEMGGIFLKENDLVKAREAVEAASLLGYSQEECLLRLEEIHLNYLLKEIIENDNMGSLRTIEDILVKAGRLEELVRIFLLIVKKGNITPAERLSKIKGLKSVPEDLIFDFAIEAGNLAVKSKNIDAFNEFGGALFEAFEYNYRKAEVIDIFHGLIDLGNGEIANHLAGIFYEKEKNIGQAISYLERSIKVGNKNAFVFMAKIFRNIQDFDLAEQYYLKAINSGDLEAANLGGVGLKDLYLQFGRIEKLFSLEEVAKKAGKALNQGALPALINETMGNMLLISRIPKNEQIN